MENNKSKEVVKQNHWSKVVENTNKLFDAAKSAKELGLDEISNNHINTALSNVLYDEKLTDKQIMKVFDLTSGTPAILHQNNEARILGAITTHLRKFGTFPSVLEISNNLDVSRKTVYKHLNRLDLKEKYLNPVKTVQNLKNSLISQLTISALNGDIRASKLLLKHIDKAEKKNNDFIIGDLILTQDRISKLSNKAIKDIQNIIINDVSIEQK